nr:lytic transglycosylase domain-containing protein [Chelativorans alearense]
MSPFIFLGLATLVAPAEASVLDALQAHIGEASKRFGIPESWIRAVIKAESSGDSRALSPRGAIGLMQLMPDTWVELRDQHGLSTDPFDSRQNILAGTAYLKAMHDRFGYPGLFAAYNAGPGRYEDHLRIGRPLPAETRDYLYKLGQSLAGRATGLPPEGYSTAPGTRLFFPLANERGSGAADENSNSASGLFVTISPRKLDEE